MAHEFAQVGSKSVNLSHVTHAEFDGAGNVLVALDSGGVLNFTGEAADALAKAVGRHDAKHATAKEAKADEKAAEADEPKKGHGHGKH